MVDIDNEPNVDTDVSIVGAGFIGLTTACALGHHGVRARIFEEGTEPKPNSRANSVWASPQELLEDIGVGAALVEKSYLIERQTVLLDGQPLDEVPLDEVRSPYVRVLYSGEDIIETTLSKQAAANGVVVERGRRVVDISRDEDGVTVTVAEGPDGKGPEGREPAGRPPQK